MKTLKTLTLLAAIGVAFGVAGTAQAVPIPVNGPWQEFSFTGVGVPAAGCRPADPGGTPCVPSVAGNSVFVGAPPWTFNLPQNGFLTVTDAFLYGDSFNIFDFGALIGATPVVAVGGTCGSNPDICSVDPLSSHTTLALAPGAHAITIVPTASPFGGGAAYFRVVPEPESLALVAIGLLSAGVVRRAKTA